MAIEQEIHEIMSSDSDDLSLNSVFEIEDALVALKELANKVDFLKGLKKHRIEQIDNEINEQSNRVERLRKIILKTMVTHEPDQKTLDFPAVGKVTRRSGKDDWLFEDQDAMLEFFQNEGVKSDVVKIKESIDTRAAKSMVDHYSQNGVNVPGVARKQGEETISITFADRATTDKSTKAVQKQPAKKSSKKRVAKNSLDELEDLEV